MLSCGCTAVIPSGECSQPAGLVLLQSRQGCHLLLAVLWCLLAPFLAAAHS